MICRQSALLEDFAIKSLGQRKESSEMRETLTSRTSLLIASHTLIFRLALVFWPEAGMEASSTLLGSRGSILLLPDQLLLLLLVIGSLLLGLMLRSFLCLLLLLTSYLLGLLLLLFCLLFGTELLAGFLLLC
ncbi:hypothetical protein DL98DRAFT_209686 [Cadophora sp. DSE1049]|nr:hypothetical protein DL98DRAFT_209686 [Cadophora sp. DSE1049]